VASDPAVETRRATVLVYSNHERTRDRVRLILGRRPARGLELEYVETSTGQETVDECEDGGIDLAILDGEAWPTGGMGVCRQLKDELAEPPPVLLLVGRRDDAWLATWCRAERVVPHPLDAVQLVQVVTEMLGGRRAPTRA
jgi:DNA-binding response OmpR family regulator